MRILFIGVGFRPFFGGGMVLYMEDLMAGLAEAGHEVTYFAAVRHDLLRLPYLRERRLGNVRLIELVNSPAIRSDSPTSECANPRVEGVTRRVLAEARPDVVHLADLRGHCASIIGVVKDAGLPAVKMMHNYWDLCPQTHLLDTRNQVCVDYRDGRGCVECHAVFPKPRVTLARRTAWTFAGTPLYPLLRRLWRLSRLGPGGSDGVAGRAGATPSPADYAGRRAFFLEQLRRLDLVIFQSRRSAEIFGSFDLPRSRFRVIPVTLKRVDHLSPRPLRNGAHPVTFGYRGTLAHPKGVHFLVDAFATLDRRNARLLIFGDGDPRYAQALRERARGMAVEFRGPYAPDRLEAANSEIDVGVVPSIWEDIFPVVGVEYIQSRIPLICTTRGGARECVRPGETGLLFDPDQPGDLARAMRRFVDDPCLIREMQSRMRPWKTMGEHVREMLAAYEEAAGWRAPAR